MNELKKITDIILNRESFKSITGRELCTMLEKWPWCSTLHMLVIKKLHSDNDPLYYDRLKKSAIMVPDRTILFRLIHDDRFSPVITTAKTEEILQTITKPDVASALAEQDDTSILKHETESLSEGNKDISYGDELIDVFIRNEPRIKPREGDFTEAVLIAEKSNEPSFEFVTETLANIYLQQGNRKQAIKIFKQLSLTIPKKSSYFAARVEELQKPG